MSEATPRPWRLVTWSDYEQRQHVEEILGPSGAHVVCGGHDYDDGMYVSMPDGELIVQAVNQHAALTAVAEAAIAWQDAPRGNDGHLRDYHFEERLLDAFIAYRYPTPKHTSVSQREG